MKKAGMNFNITTGSKIVYCDYCGEYLGDMIKGRLFKFGREIFTKHKCKGMQRYRYRRNKTVR